jgi:hypothetical protein
MKRGSFFAEKAWMDDFQAWTTFGFQGTKMGYIKKNWLLGV